MYRVSTRTPSKEIAAEYRMDELRAEIRREAINAKCDELTGAIVEEIEVLDLEKCSIIPMEVEVSWPDKRSLLGVSAILLINSDRSLYFDLEVDVKINETRIWFTAYSSNFIYSDEFGEETMLDLPRDVRDHLNEAMEEYFSQRGTFDDYESEEINEANRRYMDDSNPQPMTL